MINPRMFFLHKIAAFFQKVEEYIDTNRKIEILAILLPVLIFISYFYCIISYSVNFPFYDDFNAILVFIQTYNDKHSFPEKFLLLFEQHNEHRIAFDRVVTLSYYKLFSTINFKALIFIGNISLFFIIAILYRSVLYKNRINLFYLIPIPLLVLNHSYYEVSFWAMASLQNMWVLVFAMTSLYFLYQETNYSIYIALFFAVVATFTSGNGMMTFIAGAIVLGLNKKLFNYKIVLWLLFGVVSIFLYFKGYTSAADHPSVIKTLFDKPLVLVGFFFTFLGGSFHIVISIIIGLVVLLFCIIVTFKKYYTTNPVLYSYLLFFLLTAIAVTLGRGGFGIEQATCSRYMINSSVFMAVCYLVFISIWNKKMKAYHYFFLLIMSFCFHVYSYDEPLSKQINLKNEFDRNYSLLAKGVPSNFNFGWPHTDKDKAQRMLIEADKSGIFIFKFVPDSIIVSNFLKKFLPEANEKVEFHIDLLERKKAGELLIIGWAFLKREKIYNTTFIVLLRDSTRQNVGFCLPIKMHRSDVNELYKKIDIDNSSHGFIASLETKALKPGKYKLFLILTNGETKKEIDINKDFIIE